MVKQRLFVALVALFLSISAVAKSSDNPFEKGISVDIGRDAKWVISDKAATRSGSDSGTYYHLFYDRKQLRLRITESVEDSVAAAKHHDQFAVHDILVDGKRLPVFQWCLNNQQRHKRFLQQGLQVKKDVCNNQGEIGTFSIRLNASTLDALGKGKKLTFDLKPFRTPVIVNFDISDFSKVVAKLNTVEVPVAAKPLSLPLPAPAAVAAPVPVPAKTCKASPPADFSEVAAIDYNCADAAAKAKATASINANVNKAREQKKKVAAEREKKRLEAEAAKKAEEERLAAEAAALAASAAQQEAINNEISNRMLPVCQKKWAKGEHRCYCEKFIEHAPKAIQESSTCSGS